MENSSNNANSWGIYPTLLPGTPDLAFGPGGSPNTSTEPESNLSLPTMHFSRVVLPQPDGPEKIKKIILIYNEICFIVTHPNWTRKHFWLKIDFLKMNHHSTSMKNHLKHDRRPSKLLRYLSVNNMQIKFKLMSGKKLYFHELKICFLRKAFLPWNSFEMIQFPLDKCLNTYIYNML